MLSITSLHLFRFLFVALLFKYLTPLINPPEFLIFSLLFFLFNSLSFFLGAFLNFISQIFYCILKIYF